MTGVVLARAYNHRATIALRFKYIFARQRQLPTGFVRDGVAVAPPEVRTTNNRICISAGFDAVAGAYSGYDVHGVGSVVCVPITKNIIEQG